jgi:hypothetical protein
MRSECVPVGDRDEVPVDGGWGEWNRSVQAIKYFEQI